MGVKVKLSRKSDEVLLRELEIVHSEGSLKTPAYMVNPSDIDRILAAKGDLDGVVELSVRLTVDDLEMLEASEERTRGFNYRIASLVRRIPKGQLVVTVPIIEGKKEVKLDAGSARRHAEHAAELVLHPSIDIVCVPVFHKLGENYIEGFVEGFLSTSTSFNRYIVPTIPYTSRATRRRLVSTYTRWFDRSNYVRPEIVCVDYGGSNPITRYSLHNFVVTYVKTLEDGLGDPVAVLGVNVKYSRVASKYSEIPARDAASYFALLDIQGRNHLRRPLPAEVAKRAKGDPLRAHKILDRNRYLYTSLAKALEGRLLDSEEEKLLSNIDEARVGGDKLEDVVRLINTKRFIEETKTLKDLLEKADPSQLARYLKEKEAARVDKSMIRNIEKLAATYRSRRLY